METIGKKIRRLRNEMGISQEDLAFDLGVARQTVSNWEIDAKLPSTDNIIALTDYFKVGADYFLSSSNIAKETAVAVAEVQPPEAEEEIDNKLVINKTLFIVLLVLLLSVFVLNIIFGVLILYIVNNGQKGIGITNTFDFEWIGIVCTCIGVLALIGAIVLTVLWLKSRRKSEQPPVDGMQPKDGRQEKELNL